MSISTLLVVVCCLSVRLVCARKPPLQPPVRPKGYGECFPYVPGSSDDSGSNNDVMGRATTADRTTTKRFPRWTELAATRSPRAAYFLLGSGLEAGGLVVGGGSGGVVHLHLQWGWSCDLLHGLCAGGCRAHHTDREPLYCRLPRKTIAP